MSCEHCPYGGGPCVVCAFLETPPDGDPLAGAARPHRTPPPDCVRVQVGRDRLTMFRAGGIQHEQHAGGFGWCLACDDDVIPLALLGAGLAARSATWPDLMPLTVDDFQPVGACDETRA